MGIPHILAIPFAAQGHVIPLMELCQCLINQGFKVTFVNTDHNHKRVINAMSNTSHIENQIRLVSIPDGMEPWEDRNDLGKLCEATQKIMRVKLEELITKINESESDKITCVIADESFGWALEVAEKLNIKRAAFWPAAAALLALGFSIPKLIHDAVINNNGVPVNNQKIQLAPKMPTMKTEHLVWACIGDAITQRIVFETMSRNNQYVKLADWILCNSANDLEPAAFAFAPEILPIGPMLASTRLGISSGSFWAEDLTCLEWLDLQPPSSVIYVAFGSFTVFDKTQFHELALGLEISKRPFLWVVREDIGDGTSHAYPDGFLESTGSRGRIVSWAPQQKVLGHGSIACFLTHCGWNSTLEGVSNGVPFLCWPYFADQFMNESYICDVWKVGLGFKRDESGIIKQGEIKAKVDQLLGDEEFKARAFKLKELTMNNVMAGGQSDIIFKNFIEWINSQV
ncbi:UDP-glucuronosyl/UDP-glucosyltransferase [Trema orientale]|uniref:UDP-glucuronosyl/UDP-glucosyltransferase n=1 Tax=Trema orientale TaxID=63057 RepID=A0A2P5ED74_TREOI|nr:UDP-glucuronosyl/UDP-glucosyltransferase [Trema orientale]